MTDAARLAALLTRMRASGYGAVVEPGPGPGWVRLDDLLADPDAIRQAATRHGLTRGYDVDATDLAVSAGLLSKALLGGPISTMIAGWALDRWIPDLRADNLAVRIDDGRPRCAPIVAGTLPGADTDAGAGALVAAIDELAALTIDGVRSAVRVGSRLLWGNVALQTRTPFQVLFPIAGERADRDYELMVATYARVRPLVHDIAATDRIGRPFHVPRRRTCCLLYQVPGRTYCSTCNLLPDDEGTAALVERALDRRDA